MADLDGSADYVSWVNYPFAAELVGRLLFGGVWIYSWREMILDPTSSEYLALEGGRSGTPADCPAYEINNTPVPTTQPGVLDDPTRPRRLVFMRLRGIANNGELVYEFKNPQARYGTWVRLTAYSSPYYSFKEVIGDGTGADRPNGVTGTLSAREFNDQPMLADPTTGTVVWAWLSDGPGEPWLFAGTGLTIEEADGTPRYLGVTTLRVDQSDGLSLTQPLPGVARLDLLPASSTQAGIVALADQQLGIGRKSVEELSLGPGPSVPRVVASLTAGPGGSTAFTLELRSDPTGHPTDTGGWLTLQRHPAGSGTTRLYLHEGSLGSTVVGYGIQTFAATYDGGTATVAGMQFVGGLYISGSPTFSLTIGSSPIGGGTTNDLLYVGPSGELEQASLGWGLSLSGGTLAGTGGVAIGAPVSGGTDGDLMLVGVGGVVAQTATLDGGAF
jgi:hypothetical protein